MTDFKAEDALEKIDRWYRLLDYYLPGDREIKEDARYLRDFVIFLNQDKKADRLRFAKKFKVLFQKQNKELAIENLELKKELAEKRIKEIVDVEDRDT